MKDTGCKLESGRPKNTIVSRGKNDNEGTEVFTLLFVTIGAKGGTDSFFYYVQWGGEYYPLLKWNLTEGDVDKEKKSEEKLYVELKVSLWSVCEYEHD